jgi:DNA polymerase-3 subunit delta
MGQSKNILKDIENGKIQPVYLLHGEESYLIEDTLAEMIELLAPKKIRDFNLDVFSDPETPVSEILSLADTYPVMAERRVVVVKDPAFLDSKKKADPMEIFRQSFDLYRMGNLSKSGTLLARALDIEPEEFAEGGTGFRRALEDFKKDNDDELSSDEIEFLNDTAIKLTTEIDLISFSPSLSDKDRLLEYLDKGTPPTTVLIFALTSSIDSRSKLVKAISKAGTVASFSRLRQSYYVSSDPMYRIVADKLKKHGKNITPDAFSELQKKTGNDMRQIFDELDKLVTFVGDRLRIEKRDIEDLVTKTSFDRIFDLTNAIGQRSLPLALSNLKSILEKGEPPVRINHMLIRQIRFLLQAKLLLENKDLSTDIPRMSYDAFQKRVYKKLPTEVVSKLPESKQLNLLKQHPYALHITLRQANNFTVQELTNAMEQLLEADIKLKTGRLTPELVIEILVMDLCSISGNTNNRHIYSQTNPR